MAIPFARSEYVKRSDGDNACQKAAYNSRERIHFQGNKFFSEKVYDWSFMEKPAYHEVLLPDHADKVFLSMEVLWNIAEQKEIKRNSQPAKQILLALPDDPEISIEDRIELSKLFFKEYIDKGLAVQIDIHQPTNGRNWHVHALMTTRYFTEDGKDLGKKARDLGPEIRTFDFASGAKKGLVVKGSGIKDKWVQIQNEYFETKGLSLRVDPEGVVSQIHLGPVRMRGEAQSLKKENELKIELNKVESLEPEQILKKITHNKSIFSFEDVERYLNKYVDVIYIPKISEMFWGQEEIVQLLDKDGKELDKFTTKKIIDEEKNISYLADNLRAKKALKVNAEKALKKFGENLSEEQKTALQNILTGSKFSCIEGHAGTGKSNLLVALKDSYEAKGYIVRGFGPDSSTAEILREKGFNLTENQHRFLFSLKKRNIVKGREIWVVDEAGKLGNKLLAEFLRAAVKHNAQVVLSGCSSQLGSVERGNMFTYFSRKYGAERLENIQRQKEGDYLQVASSLAYGKIGEALDQLTVIGGMRWTKTKEQAMEELIKGWITGREKGSGTSIIIAHSNKDVRKFNEMVHEYRKEKGELGKEFECLTSSGEKIKISEGDKILFKKNENAFQILNGSTGTLIQATNKKFVVLLDGNKKEKIAFDPSIYKDFQLGYARTFFGVQGTTVNSAYVYFTKQLNKEAVYVGLTRQTAKAYLFIPEEEVKNLASLKWLSQRTSLRESTLDFLTKDILGEELDKSNYNKKIQDLKESEFLKDRIKGYAFATWGVVNSRIKALKTYNKMTESDPNFYNFKENTNSKTYDNVDNVDANINKEKVQKNNQIKKLIESDSLKDKAKGYVYQAWDIFSSNVPSSNTHSPIREIIQNEESQQLLSQHHDIANKRSWKELSTINQDLLKIYFQQCCEASNLREVIQTQAEEFNKPQAPEENSPIYSDWLEIIEQRGLTAYKFHKNLNEDAALYLGSQAADTLISRAIYYEKTCLIKKQFELEQRLKKQINPLITLLFPNQEIKQKGQSLLIGSENPISIIQKGERAGRYYDFSKKDSGGTFKLTKEKLNLEDHECIVWLEDFLEKVQVEKCNKSQEAAKDWVSLKPLGETSPSLAKISKSLAKKYYEKARYPYRNELGEILFYKLELINKETNEESNLPLSYGYFKVEGEDGEEKWTTKGEEKWAIRGYLKLKKPLYNLHKILENKRNKVLIVEEEAIIDKIEKRFEDQNITCTTWYASINKTDWSSLKGRDVIIWPNNDAQGYGLAGKIRNELRKVGANSIGVIDLKYLHREFPDKWNLSLSLPLQNPNEKINSLIRDVNWHGLINKTDWSFKGRNVFPNKDAQGYGLPEEIRNGLKKVGESSIGVIDLKYLQGEFSDKKNWSLPLSPQEGINSLIHGTSSKSIHVSNIIERYSSAIKDWVDSDILFYNRVNDILVKIENRLSKVSGIDTKETNERILLEFDKVMDKSKIDKILDQSKPFENLLYFQILSYFGSSGTIPSKEQILEMDKIASSPFFKRLKDDKIPSVIKLKEENEQIRNNIINYSFDKALSTVVEATIIKKEPLSKVERFAQYTATQVAIHTTWKINIENCLDQAFDKENGKTSHFIELEQDENKLSVNPHESSLSGDEISSNDEPPKDILERYLIKSKKAASLHQIIQALEIPSRSLKEERKQACYERNESAYKVLNTMPIQSIRERLSKDAYEILKNQAIRYESVEQKKNTSEVNLEQFQAGLLENIEDLLGRLFPDGPTRRERDGYRYGSKGSLKVTFTGPKAGCYYNFETGEGGGLFQLVRTTLGLSKDETFKWIRNFNGISSERPFKPARVQSFKENKDQWVSVIPCNVSAPELKEISRALNQNYNESARHAYHDENGNILFYTLRLIDKKDASKKSVLPLSYGYFNGQSDVKRWTLKRFQDNQKTSLYNMHLLYKNPELPVLIVEGEKTADAACKLLEKDYVVISWLGGSSAAAKANWEPLNGRDVIIWPDNDSPGFKAAYSITSSLKQIGVKSLKIVSQEALQDLPYKWDLADPLPEGKSATFIQEAILRAESKAISMDRVESIASRYGMPFKQFNEIICEVDSRLRDELERQYGAKTGEIETVILREAVNAIPEKYRQCDLSSTYFVEPSIQKGSERERDFEL